MSLFIKTNSLFNNYILYYLVISLVDQVFSKFKTILKLLEVLHNVIKVYQFLYINKNILYRNILENNIIITNLEKINSFKSMLIDLDFIKEVSSEYSNVYY